MNKDKFYLQGKDANKEGFSRECNVNFEWNMLYECNYRCPHCIFEGKWEEYGPRTVYLSVAEWMKIWKRIYDRYGRTSLIITGGEPFIYPDFINLIEQISAMHHPINISTNASGDLIGFANKINPERVGLNLSFQPGFNNLDNILEKVQFLKKKGFNTSHINICAYPPYLNDIDVYIEKAYSQGEILKVIPFYGKYENVEYPDGYNEREKKLLGMDKSWEKNVRRKGKLCSAGYKSALIFPDGKVARCGQIGERFLIGNIFDENFHLLEKPLKCDVDLCPCLEGNIEDE